MNFTLQTNFSNLCRICLTENSSMKSVFTYEKMMEQRIMVCDMLMSCASILVLHGDGLPENICFSCSGQVSTAYLFRKLCEKSDATLRECTAIVPLNNDPSNIFAIQMENNPDNNTSEISLAEKSLNHYEKPNFENKTCETVIDNSVDIIQNIPDNSYDNESNGTGLNTNDNNFSLDSYSADILDNIDHKTFTCEQCGKKFNSKTFLTRHLSAHERSSPQPEKQSKTGIIKKYNRPHTCDVCNKTFRFHSNLERHRLTHTGEKPYLCNVCGKGFAQMAYLKIHAFIHTGEKPYKCRMCERSFAAPGTLITHVRTHTGERPHICKICGKDFPQSGYLAAHIRTHTGEKPIQCKVCNRRFNQSGRLIVHMRIHSGEKPYQCTTCGKSFAVKGTLRKHIRTHTGERPYKCKVCSQAFTQNGTLATHMKTHKAANVENTLDLKSLF